MDTPISHNKGCRKVARTTPLRRRPRTRVGRPPARAWRRKRGPRPHQPSDRPWFPCAGDRLPRQRREAEWSHESGAGGFSEEAVGLAGTFRAGCKCSVGRPHRGGRWKVGKAVSRGARDGSTAGPGRRRSLLPPSPVSRRLSSPASGLKDRGTCVYKNKTREVYSANGQNWFWLPTQTFMKGRLTTSNWLLAK